MHTYMILYMYQYTQSEDQIQAEIENYFKRIVVAICTIEWKLWLDLKQMNEEKS